MGVSRATGLRLLPAQTIWVLCRIKKLLPHYNQQRACELPLGTQKIPYSPEQMSLSSFTVEYSPLGYWQLRVLLLMGRKNSGCMIKDFSDSCGHLKLEQTGGKAGIKLLNLANAAQLAEEQGPPRTVALQRLATPFLFQIMDTPNPSAKLS